MSVKARLWAGASLVAMLASGAANAQVYYDSGAGYADQGAAPGAQSYSGTKVLEINTGSGTAPTTAVYDGNATFGGQVLSASGAAALAVTGGTTTVTIGATGSQLGGVIGNDSTGAGITVSGSTANLSLTNYRGQIYAGSSNAVAVNSGGTVAITLGGAGTTAGDYNVDAKNAFITYFDDANTGANSAIYVNGATQFDLTANKGAQVRAETKTVGNLGTSAGAIVVTGAITNGGTITLGDNTLLARTVSGAAQSGGIAIDMSGHTGGAMTVDIQSGSQVYGAIKLSSSVNDTVKIGAAAGALKTSTFDGSVVAGGSGVGNVVFYGGGATAAPTGNLGQSGTNLNSVQLTGDGTNWTTNNSKIYANTLTIGNGSASDTTTLNLSGSSTISNAVSLSNQNAALVITSSSATPVGGAITATNSGYGTVTMTAIAGGNSLNAIGDATNSIGTLILKGAGGAGNVTLSGDTYANTITLSQTTAVSVVASGKLVGAVTLNNGSTLTIKDSYTGTITSGSAGTGTVTFDKTGGGTITSGGAIGSTRLSSVVVANGTTLSLGHDLAATGISANGTINQTAGTMTANAGSGTVAIAAAQTLTQSGSAKIIGNVTLADADSKLTLGTGSGGNAVVGTINGATASGQGDLVFNGSTAVGGIIGGTNPLDTIKVQSGTVTSAYNISSANGTTIDSGTTLSMSGTSVLAGAVSNSGTFTTTGTANGLVTNNSGGIVNVNAGTLSGGLANTGTVNLYSGSTLSGTTTNNAAGTINLLTGNSTVSANITNNGTLDLSQYKLTVNTGSALTLGDGSTIKTTIAANGGTSTATAGSSLGYLSLADAPTQNAGTVTITPTKGSGVTIQTNTYYLLADAPDGYTWDTSKFSASNTGGITWTLVKDDATGNLYLKAATATTEGLSSNAGAAVNVVNNYTGSSTAMTSLANAIQGLTTTAESEKAGQQLAPSLNGAAIQGATNAGTQVSNVLFARLDDNRTAVASRSGGTGIASGEVRRGAEAWVQAFGSAFDQGQRQGVDGYDGTTIGLAGGVEAGVARNVTVGASFAYASTDLSDKGNRSGNSTDIDSYVGSLYGTYQGSPWFVDVSASYGRHNNHTTRVVSIGAVNERPTADYWSTQYSAKVVAGYPINVKGAVVTPSLGVIGTILSTEAYSESGAASTALNVDEQSYYQYGSVLGLKVAHDFTDGRSKYTPELRASWTHDFRASTMNSNSSFSADNSVRFGTTGLEPDRNAYQVGGGLSYVYDEIYTVSGRYSYDWREAYGSHTGQLEARIKF
ncbi:autotransporter domain-containing protein [Magnetospirillum sp. SS-4]|uniref:autotransporter domain-containing protein n=1 Tax=Magnetospirillum sp. SS-4 TaxID=2681465 RepID=UPI00137DFCDA|nr:autotransporter domain-containing protein [Magnetospirillum sp. SS-4]CAA7620633.1 exported hypothetical protein [Magnetospirillum sp. SS-4]